jgi:hypothetical protein
VTGPDSLPVDAVAAMAGYRYAETTPAEFAGMLLRRGEALWWTYAYTTMFESIGRVVGGRCPTPSPNSPVAHRPRYPRC